MKVLLWTRPKDGIGGDLLQAELTAEYLIKLGIEVDLIDKYRESAENIKKYDIVHLFVLDVPNVMEKVELCNILNIPFVISPLYRDPKYGD